MIGCFVFSSSLLLFHWLEKRRRFGAKKIERFVIKKFALLIANPIVRVAGDLKLDVVNLGITHD